MPATSILLQLAARGAAAVGHAHGAYWHRARLGGNLRQMLGIGLNNRWRAFLAGMGITALLQSSTATALMSTSFIATGL